MNKFFKVFGLTAAIGTIAYGIIKYKQDQKFKETVNEKAGEVKTKAIEKACDFTINHPKATLGIIAGTVIGGSVLAGAAINGAVNNTHKSVTYPLANSAPMDEQTALELEQWRNDNGYADNLDKMKDAIGGMDLHLNEIISVACFETEEGNSERYILQDFMKDEKFYTRKETL